MSNIYNQTIRGMTNVSWLAHQNFSDRIPFDISQIYFPCSFEKQVSNIKVTTDTDVDTKLLEYISKRTYFYDKNKNKTFDEDEQLAFKVYIYTSRDAIKLKETFENSKAEENDVLIFIEDNSGDISSQYCRVKKGKNVIENLKRVNDLYTNQELFERVNNYVEIDQKTLTELLEKETIENVTLKNLELLFAAPDILGIFSPNASIMRGLGAICEEIAKFINKGKVEDYRWNPEAKKLDEKGEEDETHKFTPFLFPFVTEILDDIDDSKINVYVQKSITKLKSHYTTQNKKIKNYVESVDVGRLGEIPVFTPFTGGYTTIEVDLVPDSIEAYLYSKYIKATEVIDSVFKKLEDFDFSDLIKKGINVANAFLCGIWNGVVDAISGIFTLLEMIFKGAAAMIDFKDNFSTQFPVLLEYIDNFNDALDAIDFKALYEHLKSKLSGASLGVSLETIAYYSGAVIGFVVSLIIEIVAGILISGGALSVAAIIEKLAAIFSGLARGVSKIFKKAFDFSKKLVVNTFKGFTNLLQDLINFLRQGTTGFKTMIDDLFLNISKARSVDPDKKLIDSFIESIDELLESIKASNIQNRYSKVNLEKLLEFSIKNNLTRDELLGFIKVGNIKKINFTGLKRQIKNYATVVKKRGYPYKFKSLREFKKFSKDLLDELKKVGIPIDDVRIQGSALRKKFPKPKDVDLAVFLDDGVFNSYLRKAYKGKIKLDGEIVDISNMSDKALLKLSDDIFKNINTNATSRTFAFSIKNGKISASTKPRIIPGHKEVVRDLNKKYPKLNIEDISIQKKGGKLELKPDLKIE